MAMKILFIVVQSWITFVVIYDFISFLRFDSPMGWYIYGFLINYILLTLVWLTVWLYMGEK